MIFWLAQRTTNNEPVFYLTHWIKNPWQWNSPKIGEYRTRRDRQLFALSFKNIIIKGQYAGWRNFGKAPNPKFQLTTW